MAKVEVKQCEQCGKIKRRAGGDWKHASKLAEESLKDYVDKGVVEIVKVRCPECKPCHPIFQRE